MINALNIRKFFPDGKYDELALDLDLSLKSAKVSLINYMKDDFFSGIDFTNDELITVEDIICYCYQHPATARAAGIDLEYYLTEEE